MSQGNTPISLLEVEFYFSNQGILLNPFLLNFMDNDLTISIQEFLDFLKFKGFELKEEYLIEMIKLSKMLVINGKHIERKVKSERNVLVFQEFNDFNIIENLFDTLKLTNKIINLESLLGGEIVKVYFEKEEIAIDAFEKFEKYKSSEVSLTFEIGC